MKMRLLLIAVTMLLVAAACGDDTGGNRDASDPFAIGDSSSSSSTSSTAGTAATSSTTTSTTTTTTAPTGEMVVFEDPVNDCLDGQTNEAAPNCMPEGTDILSVTMTRASPLSIVIEIAEPGRPGLGEYQFTVALDLDMDPTTGITDFWPEFHGIGPDLESDIFGNGDSDDFVVQAYAIEGQNGYVLLDPPPVEWTWLDDTHIEVIFDMEAVGDGAFGVAGDLFTGSYYDHFVDGGYVEFPSGDVGLAE